MLDNNGSSVSDPSSPDLVPPGPSEDELKLLRWNDEELHGAGFVPWHPFRHPQLGEVEIGGWDMVHYWFNVPFDRLEAEVAPHTEWLIFHALALPQLAIRSVETDEVAPALWRVRLVVENAGWLPTNGTQQAVDRQAVGEVAAEIRLPEGARLAEGAAVESLGQISGRAGQRSAVVWWGYTPGTPDRAMVEWLVAAPEGTSLTVTASHDRAGTDRAEIVLE